MLVSLVWPASAEATFSFTGTLSAPGQNADSVQVAVAPNGDAVFVWARTGTAQCGEGPCQLIQARARSAAGTLSPVQTLSAAGQYAQLPEVAVAPNGSAVFVWARVDGTTQCGGNPCERVETRARSATGTLSAVQVLSAPGQETFGVAPHVGLDSDGDAVFVWKRRDETTQCGEGGGPCGRIETRTRSAAGVLSTVRGLSATGQDADTPQVAVAPNGDAVFVWVRDSTIYARARSAAGALSAVQTLSGVGSAERPQVGVDSAGNAVFAWPRHDGTTFRVQARARSAAGTLSAVQFLSPAGHDVFEPRVGVDSDGDAVFAWPLFDATTQCSGFPCSTVQARARSAAGTLSAVQTLSAPGQHASEPELGVDSDGDAVITWSRTDATTQCGGNGCSRVQARSRSAAGALSTAETLSGPGQHAFGPAVGVDPNGGLAPSTADAAVAWTRLDGTSPSCCSLIKAAVQIAPPPA